MENDETMRLLDQIGHLLAEDRSYPLDGTLLYAQVDEDMIAPSIFKNRGADILFRWPDLNRLGDALLDLWKTQSGNYRWLEIEYSVNDGRFDVTYTYPDEIDLDEDPFERRDRIVERHFGPKPIVYPPMPEDDVPAYDV